jgi:broad specificity phosphatase PhoE
MSLHKVRPRSLLGVQRITLVCHASTADQRVARFGGDDGLDIKGAKSAARCAGRLGPVDQCGTSPALRARQTAAGLDLPAEPDAQLRDCDFGRWTGMKFSEVLLTEPRGLIAWMRDPANAPHGGETVTDLIERTSQWIMQNRRGHVVAVTHPAFIRAAIVSVLGAPPTSFWRIDVLPLSVTDLRTNGRRWALRSTGPMFER